MSSRLDQLDTTISNSCPAITRSTQATASRSTIFVCTLIFDYLVGEQCRDIDQGHIVVGDEHGHLQGILRVEAEFFQQASGFLGIVRVHGVEVDRIGNPRRQDADQGVNSPVKPELGDLLAIDPIAPDGPPCAHVIKRGDPHVEKS